MAIGFEDYFSELPAYLFVVTILFFFYLLFLEGGGGTAGQLFWPDFLGGNQILCMNFFRLQDISLLCYILPHVFLLQKLKRYFEYFLKPHPLQNGLFLFEKCLC